MAIQGKIKEATAPIYLRFKTNKDGSKGIYIDTISDRKHHYRALGLKLIVEKTDKDRRTNARTMREANKRLKEETLKYLSPIEPEEKSMTLASWIGKVHDLQSDKGCKNLRTFKALQRIVYILFPDILIENVDKAFCADFIAKLTTCYTTPKGKHLASQSIIRYCSRLCTCLREAVNAGRLKINPWSEVDSVDKVKGISGKREFLTVGELKTFMATPYIHEDVRQAFIFACFCGLRKGDIAKLRWKDIIESNGRKSVRVIMQKTSKEVTIPLSKLALQWLPEAGSPDELVFPLFTKGDLDMKLRNWTRKTGIAKKVTFHVARHTFATMLITFGTDIYTVSKFLGHASVKQTQIYAKMVDAVKDAAAEAIDKVNWNLTE